MDYNRKKIPNGKRPSDKLIQACERKGVKITEESYRSIAELRKLCKEDKTSWWSRTLSRSKKRKKPSRRKRKRRRSKTREYVPYTQGKKSTSSFIDDLDSSLNLPGDVYQADDLTNDLIDTLSSEDGPEKDSRKRKLVENTDEYLKRPYVTPRKRKNLTERLRRSNRASDEEIEDFESFLRRPKRNDRTRKLTNEQLDKLSKRPLLSSNDTQALRSIARDFNKFLTKPLMDNKQHQKMLDMFEDILDRRDERKLNLMKENNTLLRELLKQNGRKQPSPQDEDFCEKYAYICKNSEINVPPSKYKNRKIPPDVKENIRGLKKQIQEYKIVHDELDQALKDCVTDNKKCREILKKRNNGRGRVPHEREFNRQTIKSIQESPQLAKKLDNILGKLQRLEQNQKNWDGLEEKIKNFMMWSRSALDMEKQKTSQLKQEVKQNMEKISNVFADQGKLLKSQEGVIRDLVEKKPNSNRELERWAQQLNETNQQKNRAIEQLIPAVMRLKQIPNESRNQMDNQLLGVLGSSYSYPSPRYGQYGNYNPVGVTSQIKDRETQQLQDQIDSLTRKYTRLEEAKGIADQELKMVKQNVDKSVVKALEKSPQEIAREKEANDSVINRKNMEYLDDMQKTLLLSGQDTKDYSDELLAELNELEQKRKIKKKEEEEAKKPKKSQTQQLIESVTSSNNEEKPKGTQGLMDTLIQMKLLKMIDKDTDNKDTDKKDKSDLEKTIKDLNESIQQILNRSPSPAPMNQSFMNSPELEKLSSSIDTLNKTIVNFQRPSNQAPVVTVLDSGGASVAAGAAGAAAATAVAASSAAAASAASAATASAMLGASLAAAGRGGGGGGSGGVVNIVGNGRDQAGGYSGINPGDLAAIIGAVGNQSQRSNHSGDLMNLLGNFLGNMRNNNVGNNQNNPQRMSKGKVENKIRSEVELLVSKLETDKGFKGDRKVVVANDPDDPNQKNIDYVNKLLTKLQEIDTKLGDGNTPTDKLREDTNKLIENLNKNFGASAQNTKKTIHLPEGVEDATKNEIIKLLEQDNIKEFLEGPDDDEDQTDSNQGVVPGGVSVGGGGFPGGVSVGGGMPGGGMPGGFPGGVGNQGGQGKDWPFALGKRTQVVNNNRKGKNIPLEGGNVKNFLTGLKQLGDLNIKTFSLKESADKISKRLRDYKEYYEDLGKNLSEISIIDDIEKSKEIVSDPETRGIIVSLGESLEKNLITKRTKIENRLDNVVINMEKKIDNNLKKINFETLKENNANLRKARDDMNELQKEMNSFSKKLDLIGLREIPKLKYEKIKKAEILNLFSKQVAEYENDNPNNLNKIEEFTKQFFQLPNKLFEDINLEDIKKDINPTTEVKEGDLLFGKTRRKRKFSHGVQHKNKKYKQRKKSNKVKRRRRSSHGVKRNKRSLRFGSLNEENRPTYALSEKISDLIYDIKEKEELSTEENVNFEKSKLKLLRISLQKLYNTVSKLTEERVKTFISTKDIDINFDFSNEEIDVSLKKIATINPDNPLIKEMKYQTQIITQLIGSDLNKMDSPPDDEKDIMKRVFANIIKKYININDDNYQKIVDSNDYNLIKNSVKSIIEKGNVNEVFGDLEENLNISGKVVDKEGEELQKCEKILEEIKNIKQEFDYLNPKPKIVIWNINIPTDDEESIKNYCNNNTYINDLTSAKIILDRAKKESKKIKACNDKKSELTTIDKYTDNQGVIDFNAQVTSIKDNNDECNIREIERLIGEKDGIERTAQEEECEKVKTQVEQIIGDTKTKVKNENQNNYDAVENDANAANVPIGTFDQLVNEAMEDLTNMNFEISGCTDEKLKPKFLVDVETKASEVDSNLKQLIKDEEVNVTLGALYEDISVIKSEITEKLENDEFLEAFGLIKDFEEDVKYEEYFEKNKEDFMTTILLPFYKKLIEKKPKIDLDLDIVKDFNKSYMATYADNKLETGNDGLLRIHSYFTTIPSMKTFIDSYQKILDICPTYVSRFSSKDITDNTLKKLLERFECIKLKKDKSKYPNAIKTKINDNEIYELETSKIYEKLKNFKDVADASKNFEDPPTNDECKQIYKNMGTFKIISDINDDFENVNGIGKVIVKARKYIERADKGGGIQNWTQFLTKRDNTVDIGGCEQTPNWVGGSTKKVGPYTVVLLSEVETMNYGIYTGDIGFGSIQNTVQTMIPNDYNVVYLSYGLSGSGKTYTLLGPDDPGDRAKFTKLEDFGSEKPPSLYFQGKKANEGGEKWVLYKLVSWML